MINNKKQYLFKDREDGAKKLLKQLPIEDMKKQNWIVVSMSAGGLEVANIIADAINAEVDMIFSRKIKSQLHDDCVLGVITQTKDVVIHQELASSFEIDLESIYKRAEEELQKDLMPKIKEYSGKDGKLDIKGKSVLLVDDGLQTSITAMACIKSCIGQQAKAISLAIAVLPFSVVEELEAIADDLYYVHAPLHFTTLKSSYKELKKATIVKCSTQQG